MAQKGEESSESGEQGHMRGRSASSAAIYHHELKVKLKKEKQEKFEEEPIYDQPQGLTLYSRMKSDSEASPRTVTPPRGTEYTTPTPPLKPIPRSKSTAGNFCDTKWNRRKQDDDQYDIMVPQHSATLRSLPPQILPSLYSIPPKRQPPKTPVKPKKSAHVYDVIDESKSKPRSSTLPRSLTMKEKSRHQGINKVFPLAADRARSSNEDKRTQTKKSIQLQTAAMKRSLNSVLIQNHIYDTPPGIQPEQESPAKKESKPDESDPHHLKSLFIPKVNIMCLQHITKGEFGNIFHGKFHRPNGKIIDVIVKSLNNYESDEERVTFEKEMAILASPRMNHPNIVQVYGIVKEGNRIVMECLPLGDLNAFLMKNPRPIRRLIKYMLDVGMGMQFISESGLVHRDLAARNVLMSSPKEICKVSDIGFFRHLPADDYYYNYDVHADSPIRWMAPEALSQNRFSPASDVWSYGILLREMFNPLLKDVSFTEAFDKITMATVMVPDIPKDCPDNIARLMRSCWQMDPLNRPSFGHLVKSLMELEI